LETLNTDLKQKTAAAPVREPNPLLQRIVMIKSKWSYMNQSNFLAGKTAQTNDFASN
jgi:hypothetical protein